LKEADEKGEDGGSKTEYLRVRRDHQVNDKKNSKNTAMASLVL
jgi:hypothetical protein